LNVDAVTVVDMSPNRPFGGPGATAGGQSDDYADLKKRHESQWQQTISHVLEYIPGVLVSTNVELDIDARDDGRHAASPRRVTASIVVPNSYYLEVWHRENQSTAGSPSEPDSGALALVESRERRKIEQLVGNLLPGRDAGAAGRVAVSTFHPPADEREAELRDKAVAWLVEHWQIASVAGLALVGLLLLRSIVRSMNASHRPAETSPGTSPTLSLVTDAGHHAAAVEPSEPARRRSGVAANLAGELADAVRQDPEAAASVLRSWIGNAS
jgi:flagellar M-ring protein FliF